MMRIFVTSATGYIGAEIAKLLLAEGHDVGEGLTITPFGLVPHLIDLDRSAVPSPAPLAFVMTSKFQQLNKGLECSLSNMMLRRSCPGTISGQRRETSLIWCGACHGKPAATGCAVINSSVW